MFILSNTNNTNNTPNDIKSFIKFETERHKPFFLSKNLTTLKISHLLRMSIDNTHTHSSPSKYNGIFWIILNTSIQNFIAKSASSGGYRGVIETRIIKEIFCDKYKLRGFR